jgi:hypothetical protein
VETGSPECGEELHELYFPANIIRVIKYRELRTAELVVRMREKRSAY